jgi:hypothetical protein
MNRFCLTAASVILAALHSYSALAESSDGGQTQAGGLFMSSYTQGRPSAVPARIPGPRRSAARAPSSLLEAVSIGALSPSEAASLQTIVDTQY